MNKWVVFDNVSGRLIGTTERYPTKEFDGIPISHLSIKQVANCRSCNTEIVWLKTRKGHNKPVDMDTWSGDMEFDPDIDTSHFEICPYANPRSR